MRPQPEGFNNGFPPARRGGLAAPMPKCAARFLDLLAKLAPAFEPRPSQSLRMGSHPTPFLGNPGRENFGREIEIPAALVIEAEGVGFEPTVSCPTSVFKTDAIDHSATPPLIGC